MLAGLSDGHRGRCISLLGKAMMLETRKVLPDSEMPPPLPRKYVIPSKQEPKTAIPELLTCMSGASENNRSPVR